MIPYSCAPAGPQVSLNFRDILYILYGPSNRRCTRHSGGPRCGYRGQPWSELHRTNRQFSCIFNRVGTPPTCKPDPVIYIISQSSNRSVYMCVRQPWSSLPLFRHRLGISTHKSPMPFHLPEKLSPQQSLTALAYAPEEYAVHAP